MYKTNIILITDNQGGISKNDMIPWRFYQDLKYFKSKTEFGVVIMGRKTFESLKKPLNNRINIVITKNNLNDFDNVFFVKSYVEAWEKAVTFNKEIWVIGGREVYHSALRHFSIDKIYHNIINNNYECDNFVSFDNISIEWTSIYKNTHVELNSGKLEEINFKIGKVNSGIEHQYLRLMYNIITGGNYRNTRNSDVYSIFSHVLSFDLNDGFPLLTTKRMFWKGIVEELLFFIRGDTNSKLLEQKGVNIWKGNTSKEFLKNMNLDYEEGEMGPMYGYQWRFYGKEYKHDDDKYIDQLSLLIDDIKNDPHSRRLLMTNYNPMQVKQGVLYPCHSLILQFYVENDRLSCNMYQRSVDTFLGLPFNITSTSLFLNIISKLTKKVPGYVNLHLGDCHIYSSHLDAVKTQLSNLNYKLPKLQIPDFETLEQVEKSTYKDYVILDYESHPSIKAEMIA
jgi:dihydrofolate reductase/thymidylate synthase